MDSIGRDVNETISRFETPGLQKLAITDRFLVGAKILGKHGLSVVEQDWANEPIRRAVIRANRRRHGLRK